MDERCTVCGIYENFPAVIYITQFVSLGNRTRNCFATGHIAYIRDEPCINCIFTDIDFVTSCTECIFVEATRSFPFNHCFKIRSLVHSNLFSSQDIS